MYAQEVANTDRIKMEIFNNERSPLSSYTNALSRVGVKIRCYITEDGQR